MSEIEGTVRNFGERRVESRNVWIFEVEWAVGAGYQRRAVQMRSSRFIGALWNQMYVRVEDNGERPITVDEVAIKGDLDARVSTQFESFRVQPDNSFEGEVLRFRPREEQINVVLSRQASPVWLPVWDLELQEGARHELVEFRSEEEWYGTISEGDRVLARGHRSSGNVLLATRLENKSNNSVLEYQSSWNRYW